MAIMCAANIAFILTRFTASASMTWLSASMTAKQGSIAYDFAGTMVDCQNIFHKYLGIDDHKANRLNIHWDKKVLGIEFHHIPA